MRRNWNVLFCFLIITLAGGFLSGQVVAPNLGWYASLPKASFNPPSSWFAPVWTVLYVLMAVAAWRVSSVIRAHAGQLRSAITFWIIQFVLNFAWSFIFFGAHKIGMALIELILLWVAILITTYKFFRIDRLAAALMVPYILWVAFAGVLNGAILLSL